MLSKLMRNGAAAGTPHGFRSAFKGWAVEYGIRDEVSEVALAHSDRDKVRAAYRRTRFLDERKILMQNWSSFVCRGTGLAKLLNVGFKLKNAIGSCDQTKCLSIKLRLHRDNAQRL